MLKKEIFLIEIEWYGPFLIQDILKGDEGIFDQKGLYQIYGMHPVNGVDNLLYIGQTCDNFKARFRNHNNEWIRHEASEVDVYLGVIWAKERLADEIEAQYITEAEKLLTYYCAPPYNSNLIYDMCKSNVCPDEDLLVVNLWKKHRLPYEVSTLWYNSECWYSKRQLIGRE